jgi:heme exporter protein D
MPELGKYADTVILAYIVSIILLVGLVVLSWVQNRRAKCLLDAEEANHGK